MVLSNSNLSTKYQLQIIFVGGEKRIISWCQGQHLIAKSRNCPVCGGEAKLQYRKLGRGYARWHCLCSVPVNHDCVKSVAQHTWIEDSKFCIVEILELSYVPTDTRYTELAWETFHQSHYFHRNNYSL
ncbi:unnamed protein product [Allacma fusca]|uniref:Uncharacterized protein n=1 Tax=Allacma fusca TaxID=39272 RepID=A0A8J2JY95_9HEXA|nr:unnamed protein product [Allacma fusca]